MEEINGALLAASRVRSAGRDHGLHDRPDRLQRHRALALLLDRRLRADGAIDGTMLKVIAWYDNEWGYSNRLVDLVQRVL